MDSGNLGVLGGVWFLFWLVFAVFAIAGMWKAFVKAGKPGWAAIIPIYNTIVMIQVAGRPIWWFFLLLIPFVNIVVAVILILDVAKNFGKGVMFAIFGLILFAPIGWMMLGFGDATYKEVKASE